MSREIVNRGRERGASLRPWLLAALAASVIAVVTPSGTAVAAELAAQGEDASKAARPVGAVYLMTNNEGSNEIVVYSRYADGKLEEATRVATGGAGSGEALHSAGSVQLVGERFLLAVNPGDSTISVFRLRSNADDDTRLPALIGKWPSGGSTPVSLAAREGLVYVLNSGPLRALSTDPAEPTAISPVEGSIAGFKLSERGRLALIPGSIQPLPSSRSEPVQIVFAPQDEAILVSNSASDTIAVYSLDEETGVARLAAVHAGHPGSGPSHMDTPWGLAFDTRGFVYSSEAADAMPDSSSVGVHSVSERDGQIVVRSAAPSLPINQTWAAGLAMTRNGRWIFTANMGSDSITAIRSRIVNGQPQLSLATPSGTSAVTGRAPVALALSRNDRYLYSLNSGDGSISAYRVDRRNGALSELHALFGLPASASGLAAE
ncbi:MAG TPA: beta-propeller fold lactonase family protein [Thermoanaerobaculales bacterium]|nr:beta-propeller fold lactonase family protein [Thermoanaerobaculales bacterium]HQL29701.1 beta-propeller fold lactonase family protein [Thermoanaerobaculales bacterium]